MQRTTTHPDGHAGIPDLLLEHCAAFDRLDDARMPAVERLEVELGGDLARLLVTALTANGRNGRPLRV
jgi:hypothetical protein